MLRQLSQTTRLLAIAATVSLPGAVLAQGDNRPVVVVFRFDNNSIGAGKADFDGMATGVQDLLITDLASNTKIRLVDRAHLNEVLTEQNLSKTGQVDPTTAARIGKILGAQYAVTGGFMSDGKGAAVLTGRTIDIETTQIANPQKITGKTDNVIDLISNLSAKVTANMNLAPKPGTARRGDAGEAQQKTAPAQTGAASKTTPASSSAATSTSTTGAAAQTYALAPANLEKLRATKLDVATMKIFSSALDEMDKKNNAKAKALFQQVLDKFPEFEPAKVKLSKVS